MPSNQPGPQPSILRNKLVWLTGVVVAALGVYEIAGGNLIDQYADNIAGPASTAISSGEASALNRSLSTGAMAAFVFKQDRPVVVTGDFKDGSGNVLNMDNWKGRVALVNLWATWCGPCRAEMPHLAKLQELYGSKDFEVVALSVDLKGAEASAAFLKEIKADNLALYIDQTSKAMNKLGAIGLPATILVDRQGREIGRLLGPADWASDEAKRIIEAAIAETDAS